MTIWGWLIFPEPRHPALLGQYAIRLDDPQLKPPEAFVEGYLAGLSDLGGPDMGARVEAIFADKEYAARRAFHNPGWLEEKLAAAADGFPVSAAPRAPHGPTEEYRAILRVDPCCYCGAPTQHVDHIEPASKGGRSIWENFTAACAPCNIRKSDHGLLEFMLGSAQ